MQEFTVIVLAALVACGLGATLNQDVPSNTEGEIDETKQDLSTTSTPLDEAFNPDVTSRIVGGTNAGRGEFKYMASLRTTSNSHFCGGSIITRYHILTAAHCVTGSSASSIIVVIGTNTLNSGGTRYSVSQIRIHSGYSASNSWRNDIAILKLSSAITFNTVQQPITLPIQGEAADAGLSVVASGWGYTRYPSSSLPNNLQKVSLSVISNSQCQSSHSGTIFPTSVCASAGPGKGVCNGDSGGPLAKNGKQIGIVSWGRPCATGVPDVYTRVAQYRNWINQNAV